MSDASDSIAPVGVGAIPVQGEGDRAALTVLYQRHWPEIVAFIRRTCGAGPPDPEDAAQAAFAQFAALTQPEAVENPRAFLFRSARNYVVSEKRKAAVRARDRMTLIVGEDNADQIHAERVLAAKQRVQILNRVLETLEPRLRDVLLMYKIEGLTFAEIAERVGVSQTWAKKLVGDALIQCDRAIRKAEGK